MAGRGYGFCPWQIFHGQTGAAAGDNVSMTARARSEKLISFREDQVEALAAIADDTHSTFTATVLDAVDAYIAAHDRTTQQMIDRIVAQNSRLLERLRGA